MKTVRVTLPATTANLGPGFDCLGLALGLYNIVSFEPCQAGLQIELEGEGAELLATDQSNLVARAALHLFDLAGTGPDGLRIRQVNQIPIGSGLGSSAAAFLAGYVGANALLDFPFSNEQLLALCVAAEGHPDNVAPALYGGLTLSVQTADRLHVERLPVKPMQVLIALPKLELSTSQARAALPEQVPLADAVFNLARIGLLTQALANAGFETLGLAMQDKLHQPYRLPLIPGVAEAIEAARSAGASAAVLSGAGPSIAVFAPDRHEEIAQAVVQAFADAGAACRWWILPLDHKGMQIDIS